MKSKDLFDAFKKQFDVVGVIKSTTYIKSVDKIQVSEIKPPYPTMVVLGLVYPKRILSSNQEQAVTSFYTFGTDYHQVLKKRADKVMQDIKVAYTIGIDNHPYDERLAAQIAGIGFFGKNQLIINEDYGSYLFLGIVFVNIEITEEITHKVTDSCGDCRKCIVACPMNALTDSGYEMTKCISYYNQEKQLLTHDQTTHNYCLFGCDICQLVCPKNIGKGSFIHPEFEMSGKEKVKFEDLFGLSSKDFNLKYQNMAYLWKGKTVLMRNGLTLLINDKNHRYDHLIEDSINKVKAPWYEALAREFIKK